MLGSFEADVVSGATILKFPLGWIAGADSLSLFFHEIPNGHCFPH